MSSRTTFSTKLGLIMAAAGSAIGLGNIWKFPYIAGENGGGAFLIVYLICVLLFGMPLIMTEFLIGKRSGRSAFGAFRELNGNNRWQWLSWLCILTSLLIMGFYFVVTGWCFNYLAEAFINVFNGLDMQALTDHFGQVTSNMPRMLLFSFIPVLLTAAVLWFDVNKGIERLSKVLMPLLLVIMFIMAGRVLTLDGSYTGLQFFFHTDFSKITPRVIIEAMGQCFFSLSIGMGTLVTYGSYMPKTQKITSSSLQIVILDTLVAILAGVIIFPAVFAFGFNPAEGPQLVFVVLPAIFEQMGWAWFFSVLFFTLLCIAALTSTISLMEMSVAFLCDATAETKHPLNRRKSVIIISAIVMVLVIFCLWSATGFTIFDKATACVMMPLGALGMSLFVGWRLTKKEPKIFIEENKGIKNWLWKVYVFLVRFIIPGAIVIIFLNSLEVL